MCSLNICLTGSIASPPLVLHRAAASTENSTDMSMHSEPKWKNTKHSFLSLLMQIVRRPPTCAPLLIHILPPYFPIPFLVSPVLLLSTPSYSITVNQAHTLSDLIAAQYCALELHLCHISLFDPDPNTASTSDSLLVSKIDTLCHGLAAANQFFDYYAETTPLGQERGFTYVQWMQTGLIIAVACKLTLAALDPSLRQNTHLQKLREALDFAGRLRLFQMRLTHIDRPDTSLPEHKRKHAPSHYENWLNCVAEWFEGKYRAALADPMAGITSTMSNPMEDSQYADGSVDAGAQLDQNLFWMELQDMSIEEILSWMGPMDFAA
ncbi:hypothetical protein N7470_000734 [Penicillium chermesinum]|nr:hypothetical protein N7470_000734 [Penicillium chermesinum]